MPRKEQLRTILIAQRDALLRRYHDAIERADAELDSRELEAGTAAATSWEARVLALFGDDLQELRAVIAEIERCDQSGEGTCTICGGPIDASWQRDIVGTRRCSDCTITQVMVWVDPAGAPHPRSGGRAH